VVAVNLKKDAADRVYHEAHGYAPLDSEIYALIDSIGGTYIIQDGIVTVTLANGDKWDFTQPTRCI